MVQGYEPVPIIDFYKEKRARDALMRSYLIQNAGPEPPRKKRQLEE